MTCRVEMEKKQDSHIFMRKFNEKKKRLKNTMVVDIM